MTSERDGQPESLVLVLDDGTRHVVAGVGLIGRAPHPHMGEQIDDLFVVPAPTKSVTKTHAAFGIDNGRVWFCDRNSVAGTRIQKADGRVVYCQPGVRVPVPDGATVFIGDRSLTVDQLRDGEGSAPAPAPETASPPTRRLWRFERP